MTDGSTVLETRSMGRAIAAALLTAAVVAVAAVTLSSALDRDRYEQAVIGLTQDSEWPFHDVHLATAAGQLDDGSVVEQAQRDLAMPVDATDVSLDGRRQTGNGILRITAQAETSADAARLANAVADAVVARVDPDTPIRVVDRADGTGSAGSRWVIGGTAAVLGFVLGLVVWSGSLRPAGERSR